MKILKRLGLILSILGVITHVAPLNNWITMQLGETMAGICGNVAFAVGWSILGAGLAFSAGISFQRERIKRKIR